MSYVTLGEYHSKPQTYYVSRPGRGAYGSLQAPGPAPDLHRARAADVKMRAARERARRAEDRARNFELERDRALEVARQAEDRAPVDIPPPPAAPKVEMDGEGFDDFSCPVCFEFFGSSHIFQCSAGHSLCHTCAFALDPTLCPQCRANISGRNIALEGAVQNLLSHLEDVGVPTATAPPGVEKPDAVDEEPNAVDEEPNDVEKEPNAGDRDVDDVDEACKGSRKFKRLRAVFDVCNIEKSKDVDDEEGPVVAPENWRRRCCWFF